MPQAAKKFLVALPHRNGGEFVRICVKSILAQEDAVFRLVVFDNASTDGSVEWLRNLKDPRITICESSASLSIEENWSRIGQCAGTEEYLTIIGHDDCLDSRFLFKMSKLIDKFPDAKLYHSQFRLIDARGRTIRRAVREPSVELDHQFLASRLAFRRDSFGTGYVFRLKDFIELGGIPPYTRLMFADDALWLELMAGSYKATLQDVTFSYRVHSSSTSFAPDWRATFAALRSFLELLTSKADENESIRDVLERGIVEYLIFWLRWAYFSGPIRERSKEEFEGEIQRFAGILEPVLGQSNERINSRGRQALFGHLSRLLWWVWRARRFLRSRFIRSGDDMAFSTGRT